MRTLPTLLLILPLTALGADATHPPECAAVAPLTQHKHYGAATAVATKCLSIADLTWQTKHLALTHRAYAWHKLGYLKLAVSDQREAIQLHGDNYPDLINLSLYLRRAGEAGESLTVVEMASELEQSDSGPSMMTNFHFGWSLLELGRHSEAIRHLSEAIPDKPEYPYTYFLRARAHRESGNHEAAEADLKVLDSVLRTSGMEYRDEHMFPLALQALKEVGLGTGVSSDIE